MENQDLSILIFNDFLFHREGDSIYTDDSYIIFADLVGKNFKEKSFLGRISQNKKDERSYETPIPPSDIIEIPYYSSLKYFPFFNVFKTFRLVKTINSVIKKSDILWLAWPHPISLLILFLQIGKGKKIILNVRCDLAELVKIRYSGIFRFLASSFIKLSNGLLPFLVKDFTVLVTGSELKEAYSKLSPNTYDIRNTVISNNSFTMPDRKKIDPIHLLFVGRLEAEKGIEYLLEAIPLIQKKHPVTLRIVGDGINEETLVALSKELKITDSVEFYGYVPFGKELFSHYINSDIFVLPSLSEGFPRVIDEARGFGLPIVCTNVGGMKTELRDHENCLKVEARSSEDISRKIITLIENKKLYKSISDKLYKESLTNTIEHQSAKVTSIISACYD
ncbi:MAG: glycosyltransferase family 4 protein [Flavobacteriaceae bacterium]